MPIQYAQPVNALLAGRQARSDEQRAAQQNALLQMQIEQAPQQMQDERELNALRRQQTEQQIAAGGEERKQRAYQQIGYVSQQALQSQDPRAFVAAALNNPAYQELFSAAGIDLAKAQEGLNSPDFERNLQVAASMGPQVSPEARFNRETAQINRTSDREFQERTAREQREFTAEQNRLLRESRQGGQQPPAGYRFNPDGTLAAIPGGPADPSRGKREATPTEGERKSAALGTRLEGALRSLSELEAKSPGVSKPGFIEKAAGALGETPANLVRSSNRQQANAAQLDALDAALTLATGAAYTREQLKSLSTSYFPQLGDTDETAAAKKQAFERVVQAARISAGRAEPSIDVALDRAGRGADPNAIVGSRPESAYQPQQGAPVQIKSDAEYNSLPSGARYIGPDGKLRQKR